MDSGNSPLELQNPTAVR